MLQSKCEVSFQQLEWIASPIGTSPGWLSTTDVEQLSFGGWHRKDHVRSWHLPCRIGSILHPMISVQLPLSLCNNEACKGCPRAIKFGSNVQWALSRSTVSSDSVKCRNTNCTTPDTSSTPGAYGGIFTPRSSMSSTWSCNASSWEAWCACMPSSAKCLASIEATTFPLLPPWHGPR